MTPDAAADRGAAGAVEGEVARRRLVALLERLRADSASGGFGYEQLRRRLVLFFRQQEPVVAEDLADEALDRLARRLDEGEAIENPAHYAFGVAKLMLFEAHARRVRHESALLDPGLATTPDNEDTDPTALAALRACLRRLGRDGRDLILAYYRENDARRIQARREQAARLDISLNSLRNRALRLRSALENCVRERLDAPAKRVPRDGIGQTDTSGHD